MFIQPSKMFWTLSAVAMVAAVTDVCRPRIGS
jgi:hypothetical protein